MQMGSKDAPIEDQLVTKTKCETSPQSSEVTTKQIGQIQEGVLIKPEGTELLSCHSSTSDGTKSQEFNDPRLKKAHLILSMHRTLQSYKLIMLLSNLTFQSQDRQVQQKQVKRLYKSALQACQVIQRYN